MLSSEQIKEICALQHKMTICQILISRMPMAYTQDTMYQMERDLKIRSMYNDLQQDLSKLITKYGADCIGATFSDKEYIKKPENRFTFDEQRKATKEVIGKELTLEEVIDLYEVE